MVKQTLKPIENWQEEEELLVLGFFEKDGKPFGSELGNEIFANLAYGLSNLRGDFQGKFGQKSLSYRIKPKRILFVGLGEEEKFTPEKHKEIAGQVGCCVRDLGVKSFTTEVFANSFEPQRVKAQVEGHGLGLYRFDAYKKFAHQVEEIKILVDFPDRVKEAFNQGLTLVEAVSFVRDLVNEPASAMTPEKLVSFALSLLKLNCSSVQSGAKFSLLGNEKIRVKIFRKPELRAQKMNLILAVGDGSKNEPRLIELEYKPRVHQNEKPYVLVGKAVCFDAGGLQIKTADSMKDMKIDMAGGAAVLGAIKAIASLNLPLWIVGLVPAVENVPSGSSYKPGDIIKSRSGKTIEIGHTDAEGRLILFDALSCAKEKYSPYLIVDIATLTSACMVALGKHYAGLFGNSREFLEKMKIAGQESGDKVWELPLDEKFLKDMESKVADLKNTGSPFGGAINAACFLQEAVGKEQSWLHLDIAGPAFQDEATGFGTRLLLQFFLNELKRD